MSQFAGSKLGPGGYVYSWWVEKHDMVAGTSTLSKTDLVPALPGRVVGLSCLVKCEFQISSK